MKLRERRARKQRDMRRRAIALRKHLEEVLAGKTPVDYELVWQPQELTLPELPALKEFGTDDVEAGS